MEQHQNDTSRDSSNIYRSSIRETLEKTRYHQGYHPGDPVQGGDWTGEFYGISAFAKFHGGSTARAARLDQELEVELEISESSTMGL